MSFRTIFTLSMACAVTASAAQFTFSTEGAAAYAVSHNRNLSAARFRIEEARGRVVGAGRLTNPEAEFSFQQNPRKPERSFGVAWMQKFPVTSRLRLEKAISRAELVAAENEVRDQERKLAGEVRATVVGLLALEKERSLRGQQIAVSDELSSFMTKRVATGEASAADAAQVELETKQLATQVLQLDVSKAGLMGSLRPLLGVEASDTVSITGALDEPKVLPVKGAQVGSRGDYLAAQATAEAARQNVELAKAKKWEDIGVGLTTEHAREEDAPDGFERNTMIGFKVSLPLPLWNKNEGQIQEATAAAKRAEAEVNAVALQIRAEAEAARGEMAALTKIITEIDTKVIPAARQIEDQLRSNYATGLVTLPEVIRARARRFELETQRVNALRDYHLARAKHVTATGTTTISTNSKSKK